MRLLERKNDGTFHLQDFTGKQIPEYAILSHTWHIDNTQEVILQDVEGGGVVGNNTGWAKLQFCAEKAAAHGLRWFWIDTCCIDKRNAVELNTAINSMFRWYKRSARCYVYLPDVSTRSEDPTLQGQQSKSRWKIEFRKSRWHTRGWTLQELIAPSSVEFYSSEGELLGTRESLKTTITEITGISERALSGAPLTDLSFEERKSWAERRITTIDEDIVYSLLGIFDVTMPLIYGEGQERAQKRLQNEILLLAGNQSREPIFSLPSRNPRFTGRSGELDALKKELLIEEKCQKMALVGLGGAGKTQVALSFAYYLRDTRPGYSIFWLSALSMEAFEQTCGEAARQLKLPRAEGHQQNVKQLVQQAFSEKKAGKWLIIVDNADNIDLVCGTKQREGIIDYLPESEDGLTIFTTRNHEVAQALVGADAIEIEKMKADDAMSFLLRAISRKDLLVSDSARQELLTELDYLPLAISQAAAYINTKKVSAADYLKLMRNTEQDMISILSTEIRDGTRYKEAANAVATTWVVTFDEIYQSDEEAADILAFLSCIEWKAIPLSMLPVTLSEASLTSALGKLCSYSFITKRGCEQTYDMHRLVHLATRVWLDYTNRSTVTRRRVLEHLADIFPDDEFQLRETWRAYLPHAARVIKGAENTQRKSDLCLWVGQCLRTDGRTTESVQWLRESYQWAFSLEETNHHRLGVEYSLARAYHNNGQRREALTLLKHVVAIDAKTLEKDDASRLSAQHELARAYLANGQVQEAVRLAEHVHAVRSKILTEDHPERLASQHELARVYLAIGHVKEAVELCKGIVAIEEKMFIEDNPEKLASQHELARAYLADKQVKEAVQLLEGVVARKAKILAEDHRDLLVSQHELARAYLANGQVQEAVRLAEHVHAVRSKILTEDHPERLASQHELVRVYLASGQVNEAAQLLQIVVTTSAKFRSEDHPHLLASQHVLACCYAVDGRIQEAINMMSHVVRRQQSTLAADHSARMKAEEVLEFLMRERGNSQ